MRKECISAQESSAVRRWHSTKTATPLGTCALAQRLHNHEGMKLGLRSEEQSNLRAALVALARALRFARDHAASRGRSV